MSRSGSKVARMFSAAARTYSVSPALQAAWTPAIVRPRASCTSAADGWACTAPFLTDQITAPDRRLRGTALTATIPFVSRLPHGHTNRTRSVQNGVEKRYEGVGPFARAERKYACLTHLLGKYPVPEVVEFDASVPVIVLATIAGRHGQELIAEGHAPTVLRLIGHQLAELQAIDSATIPGLEGEGAAIVHGDFGPQNIVCSLDLTSVAGVFDWESAHVGSPIEDVAWAEWIVRMHHPGAVGNLPELFEGSGLSISWADRQSAMVEQCRRYIAFCEASGWEAPAAEWRRRLAATERWHE